VSIRAFADGAPSLQWYRATLLVLIALCTYLQLPFAPAGQLLVPSYPTVALMPLLFLTVRRNVSTADAVFLLKIAFVLLLSIALSPGYVWITEKFLSLVQCCMALAVTVMTVRLMRQVRLELLERALLVLWCLVVVGCVLEVMGLTREISDSFRIWAYEGVYTLYADSNRDINMVGWLRPRLFSEEPSHVTRVFIASINSWLLVRVSWVKVAIVAGATVVMFLIMGSPMLLVSSAITLLIVFWNRRMSVRVRIAMAAAALLTGALFVGFYGESTLSNVTKRIERIGETSTAQQLSRTSENLRVVVPYLTLVDTWARSPLFGVGIGGNEVVMERTKLRGIDPKFAMGNNVMAEFGIYLGLLGAAWFIYLLLTQASQMGVGRLGLLLLIGALMSQLEGGMVAFRFWGFMALFWGALAVADTQSTAQEGPVRGRAFASNSAVGESSTST
jgi:hypothetical protein